MVPESAGRDQGGAERLRELPSVDAVLQQLPEGAVGAPAVRAALDVVRQQVLSGALDGPLPDAAAVAAGLLRAAEDPRDDAYPRVVNATGVVLHTGLGRAPLAPAAVAAVARAGDGYARVEVDLEDGQREHREAALTAELAALTGAEAATVVNNNAAALLLALGALAEDKDVLVSRGELIEIGGGFRLPELLDQSGARLVEVGTTNRTYAEDYGAALRWETGLVLVMHTSNYRVVGFQHSPTREELVAHCKDCAVPILEDIGSGLLVPGEGGLASEPDARSALEAGVDLVCFSGDKLLGGPQAGVIVGRADLVARCRRHPLFRALRPDRLALTALAATLRQHRDDPEGVPVLAALRRSPAARLDEARALAARLRSAFTGLGEGVEAPGVDVVASEASAGSGSLPARPLGSAAVVLRWPGREPEALARALRRGHPPVFAKVWQGQLQLDVAALLPGDDDRLVAALTALASADGGGGAP